LLVTAFDPPLTFLSLENNSLTAPAVEILAAWPGLVSVRQLMLGCNPLGDRGLTTLVWSPYLGELRELSVPRCDLTSRGITELARAVLNRLKTLNITQNERIADAGLLALCESPTLPALRHLNWDDRNLRPQTWAMLQARFRRSS
jgi:hypothetical protein